MKWYASWGHTDFILCLGYRAESVKEYFLTYNEALANDFVLSNGGRDVELLARDMEDWRITFVDTGVQSRRRAAEGDRAYIGDDPFFLATYGDGLTDAPLDDMIETRRSGKTALFISVRPRSSTTWSGGRRRQSSQSVEHIRTGRRSHQRRLLRLPAGDLRRHRTRRGPRQRAFARLIEEEDLIAYRHEGFWEPMDTIKDKQKLDALHDGGSRPVAQPCLAQ